MAQPQTPLNIVAPAFMGLNTQDSPLSLESNVATVADNAIIDSDGRLAARNGYNVTSTTTTELGSGSIDRIGVFRDSSGNTKVFSTGNNKILSGTVTLVDETPGSYTVNGDDWSMVNFNDTMYFFRQGQAPLEYTNSGGAVSLLSANGGYAAPSGRSAPDGQICIAAYGRLWNASFSDDPHTIYWSDLLDGADWANGSAGSIDLTEVWPNGYDEIKGLAAHNNRLIIFGDDCILVYTGADSPASMTLSDTIVGIGVVNDQCIVNTGDDVMFFDVTGLQSLGRVIQEQSLPITNLSQSVRSDVQTLAAQEGTGLKLTYCARQNFVLLTAVGQDTTYCFDTRGRMPDGSLRPTRWTGMGVTQFYRDVDCTVYVGGDFGIGTYSGYQDNGESYRFRYYSPNLSFGDSSRLKLLKTIRVTLIGGAGSSAFFKWGYDFTNTFKTKTLNIPDNGGVAEYGIAKYNIDEYGTGVVTFEKRINTVGHGHSVIVGLEADIDGTKLSIQELNVHTLIGRVY